MLGGQVGGHPRRSVGGCAPLEVSGEFRDKASGDLVCQWLCAGEFGIKPARVTRSTSVSNINITAFFAEQPVDALELRS